MQRQQPLDCRLAYPHFAQHRASSSPITPPGYHLNFTRLSVAASTSLPASRMVFIQKTTRPGERSGSRLEGRRRGWSGPPTAGVRRAMRKQLCLIGDSGAISVKEVVLTSNAA